MGMRAILRSHVIAMNIRSNHERLHTGSSSREIGTIRRGSEEDFVLGETLTVAYYLIDTKMTCPTFTLHI